MATGPSTPANIFRKARLIAAAMSVLWSLTAASACTRAPDKAEARFVERTGPSMGTELRLTLWTADAGKADAASDAVFEEFDRLERVMSTWLEDSEIQRLNKAAGKHPVPVGTEVRNVLRVGTQISERTGGKFDVTWGAMSGLWKFDYQNKDGTIPSPKDVLSRLKLVDYHDLVLDDTTGTAFLRREGMVVNLGGIGKGYAVDRARDILLARGFRDFMIQFGGDMYVAGRAGDRPWRLGIQDPRGPAGRIFAALDLSDSTFSTSGDYERFFIKGGRRYHHILDPTTGQPATGCRSVTIVAPSATIADGLSTGVFILGPQAGMTLLEQLPDTEGVIVSQNNEVLVSSGLRQRLTLLTPPTDGP